MLKSLLTITLALCCILTYSQPSLKESIDLLGKSNIEVQEFLNKKGYGFQRQSGLLYYYVHWDNAGPFNISANYDKKKLTNLVVDFHSLMYNNLISQFITNGYEYQPVGDQPDQPYPMPGTIWRFKNKGNKLTCFLICPADFDETNVVQLQVSTL